MPENYEQIQLRVAPIDIGFDPRVQGVIIQVPMRCTSASFEQNGEVVVLHDRPAREIVKALKAAGYKARTKSKLHRCDCVDCEVSTRAMREYYMVTAEVWRAAGDAKGELCIGCLETRLGRALRPEDFTDAPVNSEAKMSPRLRQRLGRT